MAHLSSSQQERFVAHALDVNQSISRTFKGVSDTSVSEIKQKLCVEGDALRSLVAANFESTMKFLLDHFSEHRFAGADEARDFVALIAGKLNNGLQQPGQSMWRTWPSKVGHPDPQDIEAAMEQKFYGQFAERFNSPHTDPIEFAAWIERTFNAEIHPLSDGCGRWSKTVAAFVLARAGYCYPRHASREEYFEQITRPYDEWVFYFRSKTLEAQALEGQAQRK